MHRVTSNSRLGVMRAPLTAEERAMNLTSPRFSGEPQLEGAYDNSPYLRHGASGEGVRRMQAAFVELGYAMPNSTRDDGTTDGIFGAETLATVKAFQGDHGLGPDGIVGRMTMAELDRLFQGPDPVPPDERPSKTVSSTAMTRLDKARAGIEYTKSVFAYGAGNQKEAIRATNMNVTFRHQVVEGNEYWDIADAVKPLIASDYPAFYAAKADICRGGTCWGHALVAYDWLRRELPGETITVAVKTGLDHAFVIIGDLDSESDQDLVVCDPWPTQATATLWEDHFAYIADRTKVERRFSCVADGVGSMKEAIKAGISLNAAGLELCNRTATDEETEAFIDQESGKYVWDHPNAAREGSDYNYTTETEDNPP